MNSLYKLSRKRILALAVIFVVILLFGVSFIKYLVNQYYRDQLIETENQKFVEYFEHDAFYTSEESAINYATHYSHVNDVGIKIIDDTDTVVFESILKVTKYDSYIVTVGSREYEIQIDYSNSGILIVRDREIFIINIIVISSYACLVLYIIISRRVRNKKTLSDIGQIEELIKTNRTSSQKFNYREFDGIYDSLDEYIKKIDLLQEKKIDSFNALAHDIKTPVTILLNHLESSKNSEDLIENKEAIIQSLNDLSSTASDLVGENFMGSKRNFNLSQALEKELKKYVSSFKSRNIVIDSYVLDNVFVRWNQRDFTRVIGNLLTNAFYYSDQDTKVYVKLVTSKSSYTLQVINKGEIIEESNLKKIFQKNVRLSQKGTSTGNGIGLYITKLLVEEVGATIKAENIDGENIFSIDFPRE